MSCDCCGEPVCGDPVIVAETIANTEQKCGSSTLWSSPPKIYLVMIRTTTLTPLEDGCTGEGTQIVTTTYEMETCDVTVDCTGSITLTDCEEGATCDPCIVGDCPGDLFNGCAADQDSFADSDTHAFCDGLDQGITKEWELSDEFTNEELITKTDEGMPEYDGVFDDAPESISVFSSDETIYALQRAIWKVKHFPTASCYLKVWLRTRFRPDGTSGEEDVLTDLDPYIWTGSGDPCMPDEGAGVTEEENEIFSEEAELLEPDSLEELFGVINVEVKKYSCLEGYEPEDPDDDNTRPDPDLAPNGFPL